MGPDVVINNCFDSYIEDEIKLQKEIKENKIVSFLYIYDDNLICEIYNLNIKQIKSIINEPLKIFGKTSITGSFNTNEKEFLYLSEITMFNIKVKHKNNNFNILGVNILGSTAPYYYEFKAREIKDNK
jgi:hypothetical protein